MTKPPSWNYMQLQVNVEDLIIAPKIGPGGLTRDQAHTEIQSLLDRLPPLKKNR